MQRLAAAVRDHYRAQFSGDADGGQRPANHLRPFAPGRSGPLCRSVRGGRKKQSALKRALWLFDWLLFLNSGQDAVVKVQRPDGNAVGVHPNPVLKNSSRRAHGVHFVITAPFAAAGRSAMWAVDCLGDF